MLVLPDAIALVVDGANAVQGENRESASFFGLLACVDCAFAVRFATTPRRLALLCACIVAGVLPGLHQVLRRDTTIRLVTSDVATIDAFVRSHACTEVRAPHGQEHLEVVARPALAMCRAYVGVSRAAVNSAGCARPTHIGGYGCP